MIDLLAAKRRCTPMGGVLRIGGGSKSANATTNNDARITGGTDSINSSITGNGSSVTLNMLDGGAISGALDLAKAGIEGAYTTAQASQATSGTLLNGALTMVGQQQEKFTNAVENMKTADVRVLVIVGVAVVGLAAVFLAKKG